MVPSKNKSARFVPDMESFHEMTWMRIGFHSAERCTSQFTKVGATFHWFLKEGGRWGSLFKRSYVSGLRVAILGMVRIGNPYNGYMNPYEVHDHPLP